jgi:hypothetical protein
MEWQRALIEHDFARGGRRSGRFRGAAFLAIALAVGGCASDEQPVVSGTVTVDGQPLAEGTMHFSPLAGGASSAGTRIKGGQFSVPLERAKYKVQIFAPKASKVEAKLDANGPGGGPTMEETLPPRYNVQSELTLDVTGPKSDVRYDLKGR